MAVTTTTRLGLIRWSADEDPIARGQFDLSHAALEQQAAKFTSGTTLPTPSASHARSLFYKTDTQVLYYFNGTDNTGEWVIVNNFGGSTQSLSFGGSNSDGVSNFAARADHVHAVPDPQLSNYVARALVDAKGDLLVGTANDTVTRLPAGTNGHALIVDSGEATGLRWAAVGDVFLTSTQTLTNKTLTAPTINGGLSSEVVFRSVEERWNIVNSPATGTITIDLLTASIWSYTSDATANWTLNFRGNSGNTLNSLLSVGDSITAVFVAKIGATERRPTVFQIDGSTVTPLWQGGSAPTAGNADSTDFYAFTIVKTAITPTYAVYASQTQFKV